MMTIHHPLDWPQDNTSNQSNGFIPTNSDAPVAYRTQFLESNHRIYIGHYASIPVVSSTQSGTVSQPVVGNESSTSESQSTEDSSWYSVASVDGMTCFLDQEFQDCKNRLLMQNFVMPKNAITSMVHPHARKEVTNFIRISKSISVIDKPNEEMHIGKNEYGYLCDLWGQMFKLPQTMMKYSGKHDSFWRGSVFSTLYRFITRDFESVLDENRDLTIPSTDHYSKIKIDGSFFIGINQQRNKEIRELIRRMQQLYPTSPKVPQAQQQQLQLDQHIINGTLLPFFCSREMNDTDGNQYQAENELALVLKTFLENQYNFFQNQQFASAKNRKRFVTGVTCVGPLVTCFIMRRYHTLPENFNMETNEATTNNQVEPVYVMQSMDTFNLMNYDDLLRCAKYLSGVRKIGDMVYNDARNCLRHVCGIPPVVSQHVQTNNSSESPPASKHNGITENNEADQSKTSNKQSSTRKQLPKTQTTPKKDEKASVELKRKASTQSEQSPKQTPNNTSQLVKKQKIQPQEVSPERSSKQGDNNGETISQPSSLNDSASDMNKIETDASSDLDE